MPLKNELNTETSSGFGTRSTLNVTKSFNDSNSKSSNLVKGILFGAFLFSFFLFLYSQSNNSTSSTQSVSVNEVFSDLGSSSKLIRDMGEWMERMGYGKLSEDQLKELRKQGVTATFTSKIRDLGYTPTLDELVQLSKHDVSATFASMMHSLGYSYLTIEDLIKLRTHGVTAHYTSNLHDLGYTDVKPDDLIRLKDAQVSISMVKKLNKDRLQLATVEELVRYGISNQ